MQPEWLGVAALVILPPALLRYAGACWSWFARGVLSWFFGFVLKLFIIVPLYVTHEIGLVSPNLCAMVHGLASALAELGMAAVFLRRRPLPLRDVLAFGIGIGSFEVLWVLGEGSLELLSEQAFDAANLLAIASGTFLIERALTMVGHASSRLLIYVAIDRRKLLPALTAVGLFALVDAVAAYGALADWDWEVPRVRIGFELFIATVGLIELLAAWRFGRTVPWKERGNRLATAQSENSRTATDPDPPTGSPG